MHAKRRGEEYMSVKINSEEENLQNGSVTRINAFFKLMWVMILGLFIAIPFEIELLQRLCYWTYTVCNIVCFVMAVLDKQKDDRERGKKDINILLLMLVVIITYVSLKFTGTFRTTTENIMGYLNFLSILLVMCYSSYIKTDRNSLKFIGVINIFIAILFLVLSRMDFAYGRDDLWNKSLTLGFSNPNMVAMMIFINTVFLLVVKELFNKHILKILIIALMACNIYLIYLTQARSSLAAVVLVLVMYYLRNRNYKISPIVTIVCIIFPLIFVFGYTYLYENHYFRDLEILGKTIYSGREVYYTQVLNDIKRQDFGLIFGHFTEFQNTHNSALSLLKFFGIAGMVAYYVFVLNNVLKLSKDEFGNKISYICFVSILAIYIQSCAESAVVIGGGAWIVFMLSLFAISGNNRKEIEYNEPTSKWNK